MKKAVIAATACFVVGLLGMTVSLPIVAKDVINLYNSIAAQTEDIYKKQDLPAGITELRVVKQDMMGQSYIEIEQSPDDKIHFQVCDSEFRSYETRIITEGKKAEILIKKIPEKNMLINKEMIAQMIREEINYQNSFFILQIPKTVTLTSSESDGVYFGVNSGVEFVNSQVIRDYGYVPSENENWKQKYEKAQNQLEQMQYQIEELTDENRRLEEEISSFYGESGSSEVIIYPNGTTTDTNQYIFPSDIIQMETELKEQRDLFASWTIGKEDYLTKIDSMSDSIQNARYQQIMQAGRDDLLPLIEETAAMIEEYNKIDAQIIDAKRDYEEGFITQEQYNSIVQAHETSVRSMSEQIAVWKNSLREQGYDWDSAVVTP